MGLVFSVIRMSLKGMKKALHTAYCSRQKFLSAARRLIHGSFRRCSGPGGIPSADRGRRRTMTACFRSMHACLLHLKVICHPVFLFLSVTALYRKHSVKPNAAYFVESRNLDAMENDSFKPDSGFIQMKKEHSDHSAGMQFSVCVEERNSLQ